MKSAALAVCFACCAAAQKGTDIGVYFGWVGTAPGDRLSQAAHLAKAAGIRTIRIPLVASVELDFGLGSHCDPSLPLAAIAKLPEYAELLADPAFHTVFLTTWGDSHSYHPCRPRDPRSDQHSGKLYLEKTYYSPETREYMRTEYSDLSFYLCEMYRNTGKIFAISNWEGDNELYCDAAAYFAAEPSFRSACEKQRANGEVVDAYRQYLTLRHEGIASGRKRAAAAGFKNVAVLDMIEFSSLRLLASKNLPDMLDAVIPSVPRSDLVSYSAWESLGAPLAKDLEELKKRFGDRLIAGEFGFDRGLDPMAAEHASRTVAALRSAGVRYGIIWQIFDQPPLQGLGDKGLYGLYDEKGRLTPVGRKILE